MAKEEMEHSVASLSEMGNDEPGAPSYNWQEMEVGEPIRGRTKDRHSAAKKIYDMFNEAGEIGGHFGRSGSPTGSKTTEAMEE